MIATTTAKILFDRCLEARMLEQVDPDLPNPGVVIPFQHNNTVTTQMFWIQTLAKASRRQPMPSTGNGMPSLRPALTK